LEVPTLVSSADRTDSLVDEIRIEGSVEVVRGVLADLPGCV